MISAGLVVVVVVLAQVALGALLGWLANRRNARWVHVVCVVNTILLTCVLLIVDQFRREGLTLYGVFFAAMMVWLASAAARLGTVGLRSIQANASRLQRASKRATGSGLLETPMH
jgi:hypothetical protein